jgi:hypothetical protein
MVNNNDWVEREVRYRVTDDFSLPATVHRTGKSGDETIQADLLDMSRCGLKISVSTELAFQELVQVHVESDELGLNLTESARVRWIREEPATNSWTIGCDTEGEIHEDVLEDLVERGLLDRRDSSRRRVTGEALAQWELSENRVPVQLLNLSPGGFCLASDQPTKVGARLKLTLADDDGQSPYEILARAKWQHEFENGYLIGCDLALDDVFDLVGYFATSAQKSSANKGRGRKLSLLAGVAMLAVLAVLYVSHVVF